MNTDDDTGNGQKLPLLPLAERAKRGLLGMEPELSGMELLFLEHPINKAARNKLGWAIRAAMAYGDLAARCPGVEWLIDRESYRAWRAQCPPELLSPLSQIRKWLGATPAVGSIPPAEPSLSELTAPAVLPEPVGKSEKRQSDDDGIALIAAENAALTTLRKELKREPDFDEFWDYLTSRDDTGTVADSTNDRLDWVGKTNKSCNTAKATMRNRLTQAKKRNPFTPK